MKTTLGSSTVVLAGNCISAMLGFAILAILARSLAPQDFGTFASLINVIDIGLIAVDSLLFIGVVVTASRHLTTDRNRSDAALKAGFLMRLAVVILASGAGFLSSDAVSQALTGTPEWSAEVRLIFLAFAFLSLHSFCVSVLQVQQDFIRLSVLVLYKNVARFAFIGALFLIGGLSVTSAAWAVLAGAALTLTLSVLSVRTTFLSAPGPDGNVLREIFAINKWMVLAAPGLLGARIDIIMLGRFSASEQVGYYAAALQLCLFVTMISTALLTTLLPKTAQLRDAGEMRRHLGHCVFGVPFGLVALALIFALSDWLVTFALGSAFSPAAMPFSLLAASAIMTLVTNPMLLLFFPMNMVAAQPVIVLAQLGLRIAANWYIIPVYGATGAAAVDLAVKIVTVPPAILVVYLVLNRTAAAGRMSLARGKGE